MWGPFGRGWSNEKTSVRVVSPTPYPLVAYSGAWSTGTNGVVSGEVAIVRIDSIADIAKYRGKLGGKWVMLTEAPARLSRVFDPQSGLALIDVRATTAR